MTEEENATETSPLLSTIDPGTLSRASKDVDDAAHQGTTDVEDTRSHGRVLDEDDIEQGDSHGDSAKYEGMPTVKEQMKYIFPAVAIGVFLSAADQTLVVSTYGTIGTDLHALNLTSWIATGYFLTLTAFQPLYGRLSDIFGRKSCLLVAYGIFGIGSTLCGLAHNMGELIAARALAGIGGGGMTTCVSIILSDVISLRDRGTWQGYINIVYAFGAGAGAPIGGLLADSIGWRWAFIVQGPLCMLAMLAVAAALHLPRQEEENWREKIKQVDFLGASVLLLAVFGVLLGFDRGSNTSWSNPLAIAGLSSSLLFIAFVLIERHVAAHPFAPFRIIANRSLFACYLCNFFSFGSWLAALFIIPLYWQVVGDMQASKAGLLLVPAIFTGVAGSLFGGIYMKRTGKYYVLTATSYTILVIGVGAISLAASDYLESIPLMIVGTCVCSFGNGVGVTTTLTALIANATHADQAVATACSYLFRSLGSVLGVSLCASVFNLTLRRTLRDALDGNADADRIADRIRQSLAFYRSLEPGLKDLVRVCYISSTRAAIGISLAISVGSAVFTWFIREKRLGT